MFHGLIVETHYQWINVVEYLCVFVYWEERYKEEVLCDVVNMDVTHVLLGRPLQYDVDASHKGRSNKYIIKVDDMKVALPQNRPYSLSFFAKSSILQTQSRRNRNLTVPSGTAL